MNWSFPPARPETDAPHPPRQARSERPRQAPPETESSPASRKQQAQHCLTGAPAPLPLVSHPEKGTAAGPPARQEPTYKGLSL